MARQQKTAGRDIQMPSRAVTGCGAGVAVLWFLGDLWHVSSAASFDQVGQRMESILALLLMALLAGALSQALCALTIFWYRLTMRSRQSRPGAFSVLLPLALAFVFTAPRLVELFSGAWVSGQSWRPAALVLVLLATFMILALGMRRIARIVCSRGRLPWYWGLGALLLALLLLLLDGHSLLARKYQAAHDILGMASLALAALAGISLMGAPWKRLGLPQLLLGFVAALLVLLGQIPGNTPGMRRLLLQQSRFSARILGGAVKDSPRAGRIDPHLLRELENPGEIPEAELDRLMPGRRSRDIVLITIDTLRADLINPLGESVKTPHLSRFFADSVAFTRAWSQFPSSRHGMHSMFTGHYPTASIIMERKSGPWPGSEEPRTLAESLGQAGFETHALTSFGRSFLEREGWHLLQGFEHRENIDGTDPAATERQVARAIRALREPRSSGAPRFLWLHLFDPHAPYRRRPGVQPEATMRQLYEGEVRHVDRSLEPLFKVLKDLSQEPCVIIHSDHGEEFLDHGGTGHHATLYEEQIAVPLAVRGPWFSSRIADRPVELLDLPATICAWTGAPRIRGDRGQSLLPILLDRSATTWPPAVSFAQFREPRFVNSSLDAVRTQDWKLIHDRRLDLFELYDLRHDPQEQQDLADRNPEMLSRMKKVLATMSRHGAGPQGEEAPAPANLMKRLRRGAAPSEEETRYLLQELRQGEEDTTALVQVLLSHPDSRLRRAAMVHVATFASAPGRAELARWLLEDVHREFHDEAHVVLSLLGDEEELALLQGMQEGFRGPERFLLTTARYVAGDVRLGPAVHQLLADPNNDPALDTLATYSLMRIQDPWLLPSLYARFNLGFECADQRLAAAEAAVRMNFNLTAPLVRRFLTHPDRALRLRMDSFVQSDPKLKTWRACALKAEDLARRARTRGVDPAHFDKSVSWFVRALHVMTEAGVLDWGYVMELAFLHNVQGRTERLPDILLPLLEGFDNEASAFAVRLARRFITLGQTADRRIQGKLSWVEQPLPGPGERGRVNFLVELKLDAGSAGVVGGVGVRTAYLGAVLLDGSNRAMSEPLSLPVPLTGILQGERRILCVPCFLPEEIPPGSRLGIRLGRADEELLPPLMIDLDL